MQSWDFIKSVYPILIKNAPEGELFDKVVKESEKAIMMSETNVKPSPRGACTSKQAQICAEGCEEDNITHIFQI